MSSAIARCACFSAKEACAGLSFSNIMRRNGEAVVKDLNMG